VLSFMGIRDLWSLQMTCQSHRTLVQDYMRSKFRRYLYRVLSNTSRASSFKNHTFAPDMPSGGNTAAFLLLLDLADAVIAGNFALAMMANEDEGSAWSFDSLNILVPRDSVVLLEEFFHNLNYEWKVDDPANNDAVPNASPRAVLDYVISSLQGTFNFWAPLPQPTSLRNIGITLFTCDRDLITKRLADAPSTLFASFVTPSALFCAYPEQTFGKYALAMNRFPTTATLISHSLFRYKMDITNEFWHDPCDTRCPSRFQLLTSSFAVIPLQDPRKDMMWMLEERARWRIRADCYNTGCPHFGSYIS
jgi:hypothetical protein